MRGIEDFVKCSDGVWRSHDDARAFVRAEEEKGEAQARAVLTQSHTTRADVLRGLAREAALERGDHARQAESRAARLSGGDDFPAEPAGGRHSKDWM